MEFRYAFPFEGNWNSSWKTKLSPTWKLVQIRFPVWRELKPITPATRKDPIITGSDTLSRLKGIETISGSIKISFSLCSDTLSRLKGIETKVMACNCREMRCVQIRFPVWRELKLFYSTLFIFSFFVCSDTLSRLKGIETLETHPQPNLWGCTVQIRFPVWRELKLTSPSPERTVRVMFRYAFPFEGNWNSFSNSVRGLSCSFMFRYAFPFEGNWNEVVFLGGACYYDCWFRYAFPFEGNWNPTLLSRMGWPNP